jgi:hypothetical protein
MVLDPFVKILRQTVRLAQSRFDKIFLATEAADRKGIFGSHLKNSRYRSRTRQKPTQKRSIQLSM